jgi:RNA polymerase subunit RPABC4/transcription elongation factor Spt4
MKYACKECRLDIADKDCYYCKKEYGTSDWGGLLIIIDPTNSVIAKKTGYTSVGKYALTVRS